MKRTTSILISSVFMLIAAPLMAQDPAYPPELSGTRVEVYKTVDGSALKLWIYEPSGHNQSEQRPAIVFFFGGGYRRGSPAQFEHQARYLASRGMVALLADYRVLSRHGTMMDASIQDGKAAIRWVRQNSARLGIHPQRIAAGGGSAGGHLAASTAMLDAYDDPNSDQSISHVPNALVLFNPPLISTPVVGRPETAYGPPERNGEISVGLDPESVSPYHHIHADLPPTIIFHGVADQRVPFSHVKLFAETSEAMGNRCELIAYEGADHGFFNYGRGDGSAYSDTVSRMDAFLVSLGWLP